MYTGGCGKVEAHMDSDCVELLYLMEMLHQTVFCCIYKRRPCTCPRTMHLRNLSPASEIRHIKQINLLHLIKKCNQNLSQLLITSGREKAKTSIL